MPSIEETFNNVLSLTNNDLLLNNSSKPYVWKSEEKFLEFLINKSKKENLRLELSEDEIPRGMFDESDLTIHLNPGDSEWHGTIIGYYQPHAFFLERTRMIRELCESGKNHLLHGEGFYFLDGIGDFVGHKTTEKLIGMNYELETVRSELSKSLPSSKSYKAFEICEKRWREAYEIREDLAKTLAGPKTPDYKEIIAMIILASSSDLAKNFNEAFLELKNMEVIDIFSNSGLYYKIIEKGLISHEEAGNIRNLILNLKAFMGDERQIRDIKSILKQTEEQLAQLGIKYNINPLISSSKRFSRLYTIIESQPSKFRIEEIQDPDFKNYTMLLQNALNDAEAEINRYTTNNKQN